MDLFTIGYEAVQPNDVLSSLFHEQISILVDVRAVAASRRKGFSKTALSEALQTDGIAYLHLRGLGDPKPGREAARRGDVESFRTIFNAHLATDEAQNGLADLRRLLSSGERVCLLCYERSAQDCHRSLIADRLSASIRLSVTHLSPAPSEHSRHRALPRSDQGGAALGL